MPDVASQRDFSWPGGARYAFSISWDVDVDSMLHLQHGDRAFEQYATLSYLRYDEVAVPNIVRACAQIGIHSTFFVPGWCVNATPKCARQSLPEGTKSPIRVTCTKRPTVRLPMESWPGNGGPRTPSQRSQAAGP